MTQQIPGTAGPGGAPTPPEGSKISVGLVSTILGGGLLVLFMAQNTQRVTVHFLFWDVTWPLWLFTLLTATLGAVVWIGLGVLRRHRRRVARREERRD